MRHRRGYSLMELLIVLSVGTALLALAMSVLYLLKETQTNVGRRLSYGRMIARLADQFREDTHAASQVTELPGNESPDGTVWRFTTGPDATVQYQLASHSVRRVRVAAEKTIQEDYRLPPGLRATIQPPGPGSMLVALQLAATEETAAGSRPMRIEAVLSLDKRHGTLTP